MSVFAGPEISTSGLIFSIDPSNVRSNRGKRSLINWDSWATTGVGVLAGAPSGFGGLNQTVAGENSLVSGTDPWGNTNILWQSNPSGDSNNDGGWTAAYNSTIDNTRLYRSSVWVRRISTTTSGTYYHGLATNGTGVVYNLSDGASQTNPYWHFVGLAGLTQNTWYLTVGHVYPWNYSGTTRHPDSGGYYAANTTNIGASAFGGNIVDCKFPSDATTMYQRAYHFYSTDNTSQIQFFQPRLDLVDGTEPSIGELVNNVGSTWYDISSNSNNGKMVNGAAYSSNAMSFNATGTYVSLPASIGYTTVFSAFAWIKTTGSPRGGYHIVYGPTHLEISIPTTGTLRAGVETSGGRFVSEHGTGLVDGNWHYIGFTFDGANKNCYIDGNYVGTQAVTGTLTFSVATRCIGVLGQGDVTYGMNGLISNPSIYNRALTDAEITKHYNSFKWRFGR